MPRSAFRSWHIFGTDMFVREERRAISCRVSLVQDLPVTGDGWGSASEIPWDTVSQDLGACVYSNIFTSKSPFPSQTSRNFPRFGETVLEFNTHQHTHTHTHTHTHSLSLSLSLSLFLSLSLGTDVNGPKHTEVRT